MEKFKPESQIIFDDQKEKTRRCEICGQEIISGKLCQKCQNTLDKVLVLKKRELEKGATKKREKLSKTTKKKLWKLKGERRCEKCGVKPTTGGAKMAVHPFRPADWNGEITTLKVLCSHCLGEEASKRDKILRKAEKILSRKN